MYKLHKQARARTDLKRIWKYSYKEHREKQADKYFDELSIGISTIQRNPHIGSSCDYIRNSYRQYKVNQHHIFYRVGKDTIHIVRVLHESMQAENHIK